MLNKVLHIEARGSSLALKEFQMIIEAMFTEKNDAGYVISVNHGPVVVHFEVTDAGMQYVAEGSNVNLNWTHMPRAALKAARWNRENNARIMNAVDDMRKRRAVAIAMLKSEDK